MTSLDFEKNYEELSKKINDLKTFSTEHNIDLQKEISKLEEKLIAFSEEASKNLSIWDRVQLARQQERPTTLDYIEHLFENFIELHGDRGFADDPAIVGGIAFFEGMPVTVIGHQKGKNTKENIYRRFGMPQPEGYRKALRLMKQAEKFNRPVITFINTAGAYPGKEAEERGQSEAIARNLREMAGLTVPIICFVTGEGGSGGALALGVGNRIFMLENSFYSVISPEGAASILWKDATKAQEAAKTLKITSADVKRLGIVDGVIKEPLYGAQKNLKEQSNSIREAIRVALDECVPLTKEEIVQSRYEKFRQIGVFDENIDS